MIMKPAIGILAALLVLGACTELQEEKVSVIFLAQADVKAAVQGDGCAVERLDLLVFRSLDGTIDTYASLSGNGLSGIEADVTAGCRMNWHLVANAPEGSFDGIVSESDFLARNTMLSHTTSNTLVMHDSGTKVFTPGGYATNAILQRYASKVSLGKLKVSWLGEFAETPPCILETIALVNARGQISWEGTPSGSADGIWYNCSRIDTGLSGIPASCLVAHPNLTISSADAVDVGVELYAMPNPSECDDTASAQPWAPRRTRIVIGLRIDGILQWYPIDLPAMECNTHYAARNVEITGPGALEPDGAIDRSSVSFTVELQAWGSRTNNVDFGT